MSYLSELKRGVLSPAGFLKKSAGWLARQVGMSDDEVDALVAKADAATDDAQVVVEAALSQLLASSFPALPAATREVIAHRAARTALETVDTAIGAAGAVIKARN